MNPTGHFSNAFLSNFLDEKSVLEKNVADYPASPFARLLLWNHYKKTNDAALEKFSKQSALFFPNPAWIEFELFHHGLSEKKPVLSSKSATEHFAVTIPSLHADELQHEHLNLDEEKQQNPTKEINEGKDRHDDNRLEENLIPIENDEIIPVEEGLPENLQENEAKEVSIAPAIDENIIENISDSQPDENEASLGVEDIAEPDVQSVQNNENDGVGEMVQKDQSSLVDLAIEEVEEKTTDELAFEPLHTVDYFASQGIKIKEELLLNDKLGKQMKSFTDWLKSMKKLHPGKLPEQNEVIERIIQTSAEESNTDAEVLTEAMAEVLLKQDKIGKAIEMYEKLSLINPSKSIYFAAKIESIKTL